jgi:ribosomal protein L1
MAKLSKRLRAFREKVDPTRAYPFEEAVGLLKDLATAKFNETVEVAVKLGVDARKSDQAVRGATTLPHGTGSDVRVAVFTQGEAADKAKAAGADFVGMEELAEQIKGGMMDFDVVVASPDAMRVVGQLGQIARPARPHAEPEDRHGDARRGNGGQECQGRPDALPHRQERHHPRRHRQDQLRAGRDPRQPRGGAG